jgi:hypothetical protein
MITPAMSHHLTPQDAMLSIGSTIILCYQTLWICDEVTSSISYSNTSTPYCQVYLYSQMGLGNLKCSIGHDQTWVSRPMQESPVDLEMVKFYSIMDIRFQNRKVASEFRCIWNLLLINNLKFVTELEIVFWRWPNILRWCISGNSNCSCRHGISQWHSPRIVYNSEYLFHWHTSNIAEWVVFNCHHLWVAINDNQE